MSLTKSLEPCPLGSPPWWTEQSSHLHVWSRWIEDQVLFSLMLVSGSGPQKWISLVSRCPKEKLRNQFLLKATRSIKHKVQKRTGYPTAIAGVYLCVWVCVSVCVWQARTLKTVNNPPMFRDSSLSIMYSRFLPDVVWFECLFSFNLWMLFHCLHGPHSLYPSPSKERLACPPGLAVMNKVTINVYAQVLS